MLKVNSDESFFFRAGKLFQSKYGDIDFKYKINHINMFKKFVDDSGGEERFRSVREAFDKYHEWRKKNVKKK